VLLDEKMTSKSFVLVKILLVLKNEIGKNGISFILFTVFILSKLQYRL
jgi:hypothetical protein